MKRRTCPKCGGKVLRVTKKVKTGTGGMAWAGWWQCQECWYAWDGVVDGFGGILPYYVVPRIEEDETGREEER